MQYVTLKKDKLNDFIVHLSKTRKVIAPVKKLGSHYAFEEVKDASNVSMVYIPTILPPKKYFIPEYESLIEYDTKEGQKMQAVLEYEDLVLLAIHTCDLAGIQCLDVVFEDRPKDINYLIRKNTVTLIGFECNFYCDEFANCALMGNELPNGGYDLFMTELNDYYLIHIATRAGEDIVTATGLFAEATGKNFDDLNKLRANKKKVFKNEVDINRYDIPELFDKSFSSPTWDEIGNRCLSCANCTNVCPSCYCFDVRDEPNLDLKTGKRIRVWDSCQNEPFAKISSGESFREKRSDRKRHRFYRKFKYPVDRYGMFFCTGCGRCSRVCMASINLKETINNLIQESRTK